MQMALDEYMYTDRKSTTYETQPGPPLFSAFPTLRRNVNGTMVFIAATHDAPQHEKAPSLPFCPTGPSQIINTHTTEICDYVRARAHAILSFLYEALFKSHYYSDCIHVDQCFLTANPLLLLLLPDPGHVAPKQSGRVRDYILDLCVNVEHGGDNMDVNECMCVVPLTVPLKRPLRHFYM
jgi:hypothetical protein